MFIYLYFKLIYFLSNIELINESGFLTISSIGLFRDVKSQSATGIPNPFLLRLTILFGRYFSPRAFKRYLEVIDGYFNFLGTEAINSTKNIPTAVTRIKGSTSPNLWHAAGVRDFALG